MISIEVLDDEKVIHREHEFFLAQAGRIPQDDKLIFPLLDRGILKVAQNADTVSGSLSVMVAEEVMASAILAKRRTDLQPWQERYFVKRHS